VSVTSLVDADRVEAEEGLVLRPKAVSLQGGKESVSQEELKVLKPFFL
jgi:hypothetical protein